MRSKGVSPIIASIGLIISTIIIAAFLASYVSAAVEAEAAKATQCPAGTMLNYVSNDYPRFVSGRIGAVINVSGQSLTGFVFNITLVNGTMLSYPNVQTKAVAPGVTGVIGTDLLPIDAPDVQFVVITTSCSNVATEPRNLR